MRLACLFALCYCFLAVFPLYAQEENGLLLIDTTETVKIVLPTPIRFLELGVSANSYRGDLSNYEKWTSCYHAAIRFNETKRLNGRVGFSFGFITGDNRFYKFSVGKPNNYFRAPVYAASYELQYNFIKTRSFMLYASIGAGLYNYQPKNERKEKYADILETRATDEVYGKVSFMLPLSIGATYILKNGYGIGVQAVTLNTQTDYLDNISEWGTRAGNDNVLSIRFSMFAPLLFKKPVLITAPPKTKKRVYSHEIW